MAGGAVIKTFHGVAAHAKHLLTKCLTATVVAVQRGPGYFGVP